ncbi:tRNA pseudouridine(38-40) synthase TruA [Candidatus Uabimicrobium sp. HlEnr_7]|uniref:tRNA pseudouridine(38-40) synthase TruA n=1 Tax=Candidatus Uabimicrobium helgolandensis TaxID=3095367 RepID=UPI003555FA8F
MRYRYFFHIGYNGYRYSGWQRQINPATVQEIIEDKLEKIFKTKLHCIGCGRTDAMVHASQYFFHVDIRKDWDFDIVFRLNKMLPDDIVIFDVLTFPTKLHARFDARKRTYHYYLHMIKNPFLSETSALYLIEKLDVEKMKQACDLLLLYDEYYSFCKSPNKYDNTLCNITCSQLFTTIDRQRICFKITANRFLRGMVRVIVGRLIDIGLDKMSLSAFEEYLREKKASEFTHLAYPQGLHLSKIEYSFLDLPNSNICEESGLWQEV